jgi:hypothetical protein
MIRAVPWQNGAAEWLEFDLNMVAGRADGFRLLQTARHEVLNGEPGLTNGMVRPCKVSVSTAG